MSNAGGHLTRRVAALLPAALTFMLFPAGPEGGSTSLHALTQLHAGGGGVEGAGETAAERPPDPKCSLAWRLSESGLGPKYGLPAGMAAPSTPRALQSERIEGKFRLHYDTAGIHAPALLDAGGAPIPGTHEQYVDSAGAILNEVYAIETGVLGYADPIQPSQGVYDVYIFNSTYYGETVPDDRIGMTTPARYTSHMNIDNDYRFFYSPGMSGLRVTAAHEFFHAIQFAAYGYWNSDVYFMELTSTWMEDEVYDDINDYYQYLRGAPGPDGYAPRGHFAKPDFSLFRLDLNTEYSRAILGKFIEKKYSRDVIRRSWEMVPTAVAVDALDMALRERGSSFREAFLLWTVWNGRTGPDADTAAYYSEGREYPRVRTAPVIEFSPPSRTIADSVNTTAAAYYRVKLTFDLDTILVYDTMSVIIANLETPAVAAGAPFEYVIADRGDGTYKRLSNDLFVRLNVPDGSNWSTMEFLSPESLLTVFPGLTLSPNPLLAGTAGKLRFYIPARQRPSSVHLVVLGVGMEQVYRGDLDIRNDFPSPFIQVAEWNARDGFDRPLSSGIYIYVLTVDGAEHTGKFAVVR